MARKLTHIVVCSDKDTSFSCDHVGKLIHWKLDRKFVSDADLANRESALVALS